MSHTALIDKIATYYVVSKECASYLFYRSKRSLRTKNNGYLEWTLQLQNAIVTADRCADLDWEQLIFNEEDWYLAKLGIYIEDQNNDVALKWSVTDHKIIPTEVVDKDGWTVVSKKVKPKNKPSVDFIWTGLFI